MLKAKAGGFAASSPTKEIRKGAPLSNRQAKRLAKENAAQQRVMQARAEHEVQSEVYRESHKRRFPSFISLQ